MENYTKRINDIIKEVININNLLDDAIQFKEQIESKDKGKYIIQFYEAPYPLNSYEGVNRPILIFKEIQNGKYKGNIEITVSNIQSENIQTPKTIIAKLTSLKYATTFRFDVNDDNLYKFIKDNIIYKLKKYQSSSNFGCCSKFSECEKLHKCVHENLLYATGCMWRRHISKA